MNIPLEEKPESKQAEEAAALAALGLLSPQERIGIAPELVDRMAETASRLAEIVPPAPARPSIRNRLLDRVANYEALRPLADVRGYDSEWVHSGVSGVDTRKLFRDPVTGLTTTLVRMEPGVRFPAHYHHDHEQCLVIQGDIRWGDLVYEEGDFVVMGKATTHPEIHTVGGNVLLIVAGVNEIMRA